MNCFSEICAIRMGVEYFASVALSESFEGGFIVKVVADFAIVFQRIRGYPSRVASQKHKVGGDVCRHFFFLKQACAFPFKEDYSPVDVNLMT